MNMWRQFKEKSDIQKSFIILFVSLWIVYLVSSLLEVDVIYAIISLIIRNVIAIPLAIVYIWRDRNV